MSAVSRVVSCPGSVGASVIGFQEQYFQVDSPGSDQWASKVSRSNSSLL
jgi:hypothetical protein